MIKPIQIYVVDDGTRFDKYDDAVFMKIFVRSALI